MRALQGVATGYLDARVGQFETAAKAKADKNKTNQLLLYKQFYSKQYNFPLDKIDVEFFIVKRNVNKLIQRD